MIRGESVWVLAPLLGAEDAFGSPTKTWDDSQAVEVENVLLAPASPEDVAGSIRPEGVKVRFRLHFPKTYTQSLRGCRVKVRGQWMQVVGDPQPYQDANTPGAWNRPVDVEEVKG